MKKLIVLLSMLFASFAYSATVEKLQETTKTWDGTKLSSVTIKNPKVTMLKSTVPAGEILPMHKHSVIESGYMLKGELTVFIPSTGQKNVLKAGDSLVEVIGTPHYAQNTGDTEAVIVLFYVGDKNEPLFIGEDNKPLNVTN